MASRIASASSRRWGRRQQSVFSGSSFERAGSSSAVWRVDGAGHHQLVDRLEPPAAADQLGGEPVEQFGVRRPLALRAEVAGRGDDPPAEVVLPEPVDDHPGQQVAGAGVDVGHPVRQARPAVRRPPPLRRRGLPARLALGGRLRTVSTPGVASPTFWARSPRLSRYVFSKKSAPCVWNRMAGNPSRVTIALTDFAGFGGVRLVLHGRGGRGRARSGSVEQIPALEEARLRRRSASALGACSRPSTTREHGRRRPRPRALGSDGFDAIQADARPGEDVALVGERSPTSRSCSAACSATGSPRRPGVEVEVDLAADGRGEGGDEPVIVGRAGSGRTCGRGSGRSRRSGRGRRCRWWRPCRRARRSAPSRPGWP